MIKYSISIITILLVLACQKETEIQDSGSFKGFTSWLPAAKWEDALLTGNGTMGAMVMGNPFEETIILNHALLYLPNEKPLLPPDMGAHLEEIRKLSFEGKWEEAARLGVKVWEDAGYGEKKWVDPYVPAANLTIQMPGSNVEDYKRTVNYETAEAGVSWRDKNGIFERSTFASRTDGIIVTRIKGNSKISASIALKEHPHSWEQNDWIKSLISESETTVIDDQTLRYHCKYKKLHEASPLGYEVISRIFPVNGRSIGSGNSIKVSEADEVLIFTLIEPVYDEQKFKVNELISKLKSVPVDYELLIERQKQTHGELYNRVSLNLYPSEEVEEMTSETLVLQARDSTSPGIIQRQFEAARYNILCSTGTNPPNLQGIWSGTWTPPWSSAFTHDGNVLVAISNLLNGNMPELMNAYFEYHEKRLPYYRANAKRLYGANGIQIPGHTTSHGYQNHYDETWTLEYWNGGAGWAASYFYDYFLYTRDTSFLKERAFPFISDALAFWEDFLNEGEDGKYVSVPSYSPENNPLEHRWQNSINATMDFAIVKELLRNWISCAKIIGVSEDKIQEKRNMLAKIPDYQISADGVLKEWLWPGFTDNQTHRHASHLYGLYEVIDPDILNSEELKNGALKTIKERMKIRKRHNGGEMAFGMCHLAFSAINLEDEETAYDIETWLSKYYWTNGMATTHNPGSLFNMDISGGFPSVITRMIINSQPGQVTVFPALPDQWEKGKISGVLLRGNIEVKSLKWNKESVELELISEFDQSLDLYPGKKLENAEIISFEKSNYEMKANGSGKIGLKLKSGILIKLKWNLS